jgi:hypothetical protein
MCGRVMKSGAGGAIGLNEVVVVVVVVVVVA